MCDHVSSGGVVLAWKMVQVWPWSCIDSEVVCFCSIFIFCTILLVLLYCLFCLYLREQGAEGGLYLIVVYYTHLPCTLLVSLLFPDWSSKESSRDDSSCSSKFDTLY